jgi:hypothetical protein
MSKNLADIIHYIVANLTKLFHNTYIMITDKNSFAKFA